MQKIASAMVKAQKEFGPALKNSKNPHFKSQYADLATCVEAVIDALNNNGIALIQQTHECSDGVIVETLFVHESGEVFSAGKLHVPSTKHDAQGYGSALTYARRYSLMAACGIAPEDDDGNAASKASKASEKARPNVISPVPDVELTEEQAEFAEEIRHTLVGEWLEGNELAVLNIWYRSEMDNDIRTAVWKKLAPESKLRAFIKANKPEPAVA